MAKTNSPDWTQIQEPTTWNFSEKDSEITGVYLGVTNKPWPSILVNDGGMVYAVQASFQLADFFIGKRVPQGVRVKIRRTGTKEIGGGRNPMNVFQISVDKTTLPKDYDTTQLETQTIDTSEISNVSAWLRDEKKRRDEEDELPF